MINSSVFMTAIIVFLTIVAIYAFIKWLYTERPKDKEFKKVMDRVLSEDKIFADMSIDKAKRLLDEQLQSRSRLRIIESPWENDEEKFLLPDYVKQIFSRYEVISGIYSDAYIDRKLIQPWEVNQSFYLIGEDTAHYYALIKPGEEPVYILNGTETLAEMDEYDYKSIFHYLVAMANCW